MREHTAQSLAALAVSMMVGSVHAKLMSQLVGRRPGAKPRGAFITRDFGEEFEKGPVKIAVTSFMRDGNRAIVANPQVFGSWRTVALVQSLEEFNPEKPLTGKHAPLNGIGFQDKERTASETWIWSGVRLMNLERYEALKMTPGRFEGVDYLVIEAGAFGTRNKPGCKPQLIIMKRKKMPEPRLPNSQAKQAQPL